MGHLITTGRLTTFRSRQRGLAMVEFAITAPLLLLVMIGLADASIMLYQYNALSKAAINGARFVSARSFAGIVDSAIFDTAKKLVVNAHPSATTPVVPGLKLSAVTIGCTEGGTAIGSGTRCKVNEFGVATITISIAHVYTPVFVEAWSYFFGKGFNVPMKATVDQVLIS